MDAFLSSSQFSAQEHVRQILPVHATFLNNWCDAASLLATCTLVLSYMQRASQIGRCVLSSIFGAICAVQRSACDLASCSTMHDLVVAFQPASIACSLSKDACIVRLAHALCAERCVMDAEKSRLLYQLLCGHDTQDFLRTDWIGFSWTSHAEIRTHVLNSPRRGAGGPDDGSACFSHLACL